MLKSAFVSFTAMPLPPLNVTVSQVTSSNASVVWVPGFDGRAPLHSCTLQVRPLCTVPSEFCPCPVEEWDSSEPPPRGACRAWDGTGKEADGGGR